MWGSGAVSRGAMGSLFALTVIALCALVAPAAAQDPAAPDQYLPAPPAEPAPDETTTVTPPGPGGTIDGTVCPGQMSKTGKCPDGGNDGEQGGGGSDGEGTPTSTPAAPPGSGAQSGSGSGGPDLPFTGYPLSNLVLVMLGLLVTAAIIRGGLALRGRLRTADPS